MRAYFEYTGKIDLSTILPGHNGLQGRFEQSKVAMSETGLKRIFGGDCEDWDKDCVGIYGLDSNDFMTDVTSDPTAWEWY